MKRYIVPAKYQMSIPKGVEGVDGALIFPSGIAAPTLARRKLNKKQHLKNRILDPQYYLAEIQAVNCRKCCTRLATYPWFGAKNIPNFLSKEQNQAGYMKQLRETIHRKWKCEIVTKSGDIAKVVASVAKTQQNLECSAFLMPTPLIADQGDDLSKWIEWIDIGLDQIEALQTDMPVYVTIALADSALRAFKPESNQLLAAIIDQVTSREFAGVYICLEQTLESGYYCNHTNTLGSILHLCWALKQGGIKEVILAPMGVAGFLCLGAGADTWSCGWYLSERRIRLSDMEDREGRAVPTYYSHSLASEIHTESDLDKVNKAGLLEFIEDLTVDSFGLLAALKRGKLSRTVSEWESRPSNIAASRSHFMRSVTRETQILRYLNERQIADHMEAWLTNSEELAIKVSEAGVAHQRTELKHQAAWLEAFKKFRSYASI